MHLPSIIWVEFERGIESKAIAHKFRESGFAVMGCAPGKSKLWDADVRVVAVDCFAGDEEFQRELRLDQRPTMILMATTGQVIEALQIAGERDDVGQLTDPVALLAQRVSRLGLRAIAAQRQGFSADVDPLTRLPNRQRFGRELARRIEDMLPNEHHALVFLDLDGFKSINDQLGHQAGDEVLRGVARFVQAQLSPSDALARFGSDEFVCLISRYDEPGCISDAERILQRLAEADLAPQLQVGAQAIRLSASAGLTFLVSQEDPQEALRRADMAMYEAKGKGRNLLVKYERLQEPSGNGEEDLYLRHFENVTRVVNERVTNQIAHMGRRLVEAARRDANEDPTTKLKNRRYFDSRICREMEISRKSGRPLTIALMDLDHFHGVNATFGWPTGDRVLRMFADLATNNIRKVDWLARYGGEEFCLVMTETDLALGSHVAERIRRQVQDCRLQSIDGRPVSFTVSIGVAQLTDHIDGVVEFVERASNGLLEAKRGGRNRVVVVAENGGVRPA